MVVGMFVFCLVGFIFCFFVNDGAGGSFVLVVIVVVAVVFVCGAMLFVVI